VRPFLRRLLVPLAAVALALALSLALSCRTPTSIAVEVTIDFACKDLHRTTVTAGGALGSDFETRAPTTNSNECVDGYVGRVVIVPSGGNDDDVAIKVVGGFGRDVETCNVPNPGKGCIVARRALRYAPHTALTVPIVLRQSCDGIACGSTETCRNGACVSAALDPATCTGSGGCDESALGPGSSGPGADAGASDAGDAAVAPAPLYSPDMRDLTKWERVDLSSIAGGGASAGGAVFDGRYVTLMPRGDWHVRYDTRAPFGTLTSWEAFKASTLSGTTFVGGTFDGTYIYYVPDTYFGGDLVAARYAPSKPFQEASFETANWGINNGDQFGGTVFDGTYVYPVPTDKKVQRFDTRVAFSQGLQVADQVWIPKKARGFRGGTFDGRYAYFVPGVLFGYQEVLRLDTTTADFTDAGSYRQFDTFTKTPANTLFCGAIFDGRYVTMMPRIGSTDAGAAASGFALRYDTQAPFDVATSWEGFDLTTIDPNAKGFCGGAFDGRYVYFLPDTENNSPTLPPLARFDSLGSLSDPGAWQMLDTKTIDPNAKLFGAMAFDGTAIYLMPKGGSVALRFTARSSPAAKPTPSFN
jgi:hypothetical protein